MRHGLRRSPALRRILPAVGLAAILAIGAKTAHAQTVAVTASAGPGGTISPSGVTTLPVGSNLTLTMTPDTGFHLGKLVVDGKNAPVADSYTFENLTKNHKIAAKFKRNVYTITTSAADGFTIKPSGTLSLAYGKVKTFKILTPEPGAVPWATVDGEPVPITPSGSKFTLALTVTHDHVIAVSAMVASRVVTVEKSGTGTGTVSSDPAGIDCGATCAGVFPSATALTLTAAAGDGSVFTEWTGACAGSDPACHLTVDADVTAEAHFDLLSVETDFLAEPSADPESGKAPLSVILIPDADGFADPIAFYAWDDEGDGTWDSCDPDDPSNPGRPCDTEGVPREHAYTTVGTYHPRLLAQTTAGDRSIADALVVVEGTTSEEKILAALDAGTIDEESALLYRIYADFGDPRLPAAFAGDDPGAGAESDAMRDLAARFDQLSSQTQDLLAPFLMPPAYPGSWYDLRTTGADRLTTRPAMVNNRPVCTAISSGWSWAPGPGHASKVRVWWDAAGSPGHAAAAAHIASEVNNVIWPSLQTLMGRAALADNVPAANGCFGDDGLLDIYLVAGLTRSGEETIGDCHIAAPGYIEARPNIEDGTVAHEVFHAFQDAYSLGACSANDPYRWWAEASAQWVMDHVYQTPKGNRGLEQSAAPKYLKATDLSIGQRKDGREYGAYVFPFYMAREINPTMIRDIWATMEADVVEPFEAFDMDLPGGLRDRWPQFARRAWNRAPFDQFRRWDRQSARAKTQHSTAVTMGANLMVEHTRPVSLPPLSIVYDRYTFPDDGARTVIIYNGLTWTLSKGPMPLGMGLYGEGYSAIDRAAADKKGGSVQLLAKVGGRWLDPIDLTNVPVFHMCRDLSSERVEEMVLVYANSDITPNRNLSEADYPSTVSVSNIGCYEWTGSGSFVVSEADGVHTDVRLRDVKFDSLIHHPAASPLTGALTAGPYTAFVNPFRLTDGTLEIVTSGTDPEGCTYSGNLGLPLVDPDPSHPQVMNLFTGITSGIGFHDAQMALGLIPPVTYTVTVCCPDTLSCGDQPRFLTSLLQYDPLIEPGPLLLMTGDTIAGDGTTAPISMGGAGSWQLDAVREP